MRRRARRAAILCVAGVTIASACGRGSDRAQPPSTPLPPGTRVVPVAVLDIWGNRVGGITLLSTLGTSLIFERAVSRSTGDVSMVVAPEGDVTALVVYGTANIYALTVSGVGFARRVDVPRPHPSFPGFDFSRGPLRSLDVHVAVAGGISAAVAPFRVCGDYIACATVATSGDATLQFYEDRQKRNDGRTDVWAATSPFGSVEYYGSTLDVPVDSPNAGVLVDSSGEAFSLSYSGPAASGVTIFPRRHFITIPSSLAAYGSSSLTTGNLFLRDADSIELLGGDSPPAPAFSEEIRVILVPESRSLDVTAVFPPVPEPPTVTFDPFAVSWTLPSSVDASVSLVQLTVYATPFKSWAVLRKPSSPIPESFTWKPPRLPADLAGYVFQPPPGSGGLIRRDISADGDPFVGPFIRVAPHRYEATGVSEGF